MVTLNHRDLLELAAEPDLFAAWEYVAAKGSSPGIDHVDVKQFARVHASEIHRIHDELVSASYAPNPLITFPVEKQSSGIRELTIATVRDRVVARRLANFLTERHDRDLQPQSYAYRRNKGALRAVRAAQRALPSASYVLRADVRNFFDEISHDELCRILEEMSEPTEIVDLVRKVVRAPHFDGCRMTTPESGVPQGSPVAPVLSNLYLNPLDVRLNGERMAFVRYADDLLVLAASSEEAARALSIVQEELSGLHLALSQNKTRIYRIDEGFIFLGFLFNRDGHVPSSEARQRLRTKLDEGQYDDETHAEFLKRREAIERGWHNYFDSPPAPSSVKASSKRARKSTATATSDSAQRVETPDDPAPDSGNAPASTQPPSQLGNPFSRLQLDDVLEPNQPPPKELARRPVQDARDLLDSGRVADAIHQIRRLLNDDESGLPDTSRRDLMCILADAYQTQGLHGAAQACRAGSPQKNEPAKMEPPVHGATDLENWLDTFASAKGKIYVQYLDRTGRNGFRPFRNELKPPLLAAHWAGRHTLSVPVYGPGGTVRFGLLDLDVTRATLDRLEEHELDEYRTRLLDDARGLLATARKAGVNGLIEDSGYKGYHVWFFLHASLPAELVLHFLQELSRVAGPAPEGTHRECFPGSATHAPDNLCSRIKLPLGRHLVTGRFCAFVADDGQPCRHGIQLLRPSLRNTAAALRDAIRSWTQYRANSSTDTSFQSSTDATVSPVSSFKHPVSPASSPDPVSTLYARCPVLAGLREKARLDGILSHAERMILRGILGPLGTPGHAAIHDVLRQCRNYSHRTTQSMLAGTQPFRPMSCRRIKEILGTFCNQVGCTCKFRAGARNAPTPHNHLRSTTPAAAPSSQPPTLPPPQSSPPPSPPQVSCFQHPSPLPLTPQPSNIPPPQSPPPPPSPPHVSSSQFQVSPPPSALLSQYRTLRAQLLQVHGELLRLCPPGQRLDLGFGSLRHEPSDPELGRWIIEV